MQLSARLETEARPDAQTERKLVRAALDDLSGELKPESILLRISRERTGWLFTPSNTKDCAVACWLQIRTGIPDINAGSNDAWWTDVNGMVQMIPLPGNVCVAIRMFDADEGPRCMYR